MSKALLYQSKVMRLGIEARRVPVTEPVSSPRDVQLVHEPTDLMADRTWAGPSEHEVARGLWKRR
jgi:hypothetical protein